jgi:hypothetical protein
MSDNYAMKSFYSFLGEAMAQNHGDLGDRLTPWIFAVGGGTIVLLMAYAYLAH